MNEELGQPQDEDILPENRDPDKGSVAVAAFNQSLPSAGVWLREIDSAEKELANFYDQGDDAVRRFRDNRDAIKQSDNRINLYQVNTQILMDSIYANPPRPLVKRLFDDVDDEVARVASVIAERMLGLRRKSDFDITMKHSVQDWLIPGLGTMWMRYEPKIENFTIPAVHEVVMAPVRLQDGSIGEQPATDEQGNPLMREVSPEQQGERLVDEQVVADYVYWKDFLWKPSKIWEECTWVARRLKMTRLDVKKKFGVQIAVQLQYNKEGSGRKDIGITPKYSESQVANIYELWNKVTNKIYFVSKGFDKQLCAPKDWPDYLNGSFPCPKPLLANVTTSSTVPRSDYLLAKDQYDELDYVNNRITWIERALKVIGVYDSSSSELQRLFTEGVELRMIPVEDFTAFQEKGGFKGHFEMFPLEQYILALDKLRQIKTDLVQQIYELTGMSDIIRGATKASETLGAQELKAQFAGVRLTARQNYIADFAEEALNIKFKMMFNQFDPKTIAFRANVQYMPAPDQQLADQAIQLLQSRVALFRIEVNADSMAAPEMNAERDARMEYTRAVAEIMGQAAPLIQQDPRVLPFIMHVLKWNAAGFRVGREMEGYLDQFIQQAIQAAAQPPAPPQPTPQEIADTAFKQAQAALKQAEAAKTQVETGAIALESGQPMPGVNPPRSPLQVAPPQTFEAPIQAPRPPQP